MPHPCDDPAQLLATVARYWARRRRTTAPQYTAQPSRLRIPMELQPSAGTIEERGATRLPVHEPMRSRWRSVDSTDTEPRRTWVMLHTSCTLVLRAGKPHWRRRHGSCAVSPVWRRHCGRRRESHLESASETCCGHEPNRDSIRAQSFRSLLIASHHRIRVRATDVRGRLDSSHLSVPRGAAPLRRPPVERQPHGQLARLHRRALDRSCAR